MVSVWNLMYVNVPQAGKVAVVIKVGKTICSSGCINGVCVKPGVYECSTGWEARICGLLLPFFFFW